jgi:hypothetical protein
MADLTHRLLDALLEDYRKGAMLFGSEEHAAFVESAVEHMPALIEAARKTIPGELLLGVRIPGLVPRGTLNSREHHMARRRRVANEHSKTGIALAVWSSKHERINGIAPPPWEVTLIRCSVRTIDDDNAVGSMKGIRDAVANWIGRDDGDPCFRWVVEQRKVKRADVGVVIEIREWRREDERMGRAG